jgi:hypothetical protein
MTDTMTRPADEAAEEAARKIAAERAGYVAGVRALADVLEEHDEIPLPRAKILWSFLSDPDARARMALTARLLPCTWTKNPWEGSSGTGYFDMNAKLHGLNLELGAYREQVCERVVVGTEDREVEEVVTPAVVKTVTKPVEVIEWRCHPILAPAADETPASVAE